MSKAYFLFWSSSESGRKANLEHKIAVGVMGAEYFWKTSKRVAVTCVPRTQQGGLEHIFPEWAPAAEEEVFTCPTLLICFLVRVWRIQSPCGQVHGPEQRLKDFLLMPPCGLTSCFLSYFSSGIRKMSVAFFTAGSLCSWELAKKPINCFSLTLE